MWGALGCALRRLSNREKALLIDRLGPAYSRGSMTCLPAIAPGGHHCRRARLGVDKYAGSRQSLRPGLHGRASERETARGHHPGSRPGTGRACLSPPVDCFDGKIVAYTAGFSPNAEPANRMPEKAASTLPGNARPLVHSDRGRHCRWPGWLALMERFGLTRSMSAKGCSPDNAAAEGFFGRMKTEAVYPEKWEEHTRNEVLALVDEYIRWHDHERIKQSLGWMSPVQYRQSQGMAA